MLLLEATRVVVMEIQSSPWTVLLTDVGDDATPDGVPVGVLSTRCDDDDDVTTNTSRRKEEESQTRVEKFFQT